MITKNVNAQQLAAEMAAAHGWPDPAPLSVSWDGTEGEVQVHRDDAHDATVRTVIDAHVPAVDPDPDAEFRAAVEAATTLAALKAALLGATGPGAQPRNR